MVKKKAENRDDVKNMEIKKIKNVNVYCFFK